MITDILTLLKTGIIDDLDYHFSQFIIRKEKRELNAVQLNTVEIGTAIISRQIAKGNICLSSKDLDNLKAESDDPGISFPSWDEMKSVFTDASWCGNGSSVTPVVFDGDRFYLYRYWSYESALASMVSRMALEESRFRSEIQEALKIAEKIFGVISAQTLQMQAVKSVFSKKFSVITGGPGTGKTTVIARIIAIIWKLFPETVVKLAAPTGKAAARINESLSAASLQIKDFAEPEITDRLSTISGSSIHRLLGWTSKPGIFRHNRDNPVDADILIVDEASMVDLAMMTFLLQAIKPEASVILLGDKDQLASVEAGNVLGDIFNSASLGYIDPSTVTEFTESYRFKKGTGIGELAASVNSGISVEKIEEITGKFSTEIELIPFSRDFSFEKILPDIKENYSGIFKYREIEKAFNSFEKFRILCATRKGLSGVEGINKITEKMLKKQGLIKNDELWYHGRPVMVLENDYNLELFNGDCGLVFETEEGKRAFFRNSTGGFRSFPVAVLPKVETVYATTVHKSQGSEYDLVMIVLPEKDTPVLTKELLYTAVTRAKKHVTIIADQKLLSAASLRSAARSSGLVSALKHYGKNEKLNVLSLFDKYC